MQLCPVEKGAAPLGWIAMGIDFSLKAEFTVALTSLAALAYETTILVRASRVLRCDPRQRALKQVVVFSVGVLLALVMATVTLIFALNSWRKI